MQNRMMGLFHRSTLQGCRFFRSKSVEEMAIELRKEKGHNSVEFQSVDKYFHLDLVGKPHYEKTVKRYIPTPHLHAHTINTSYEGLKRVSKKSVTTEATKDDIRLARKLSRK